MKPLILSLALGWLACAQAALGGWVVKPASLVYSGDPAQGQASFSAAFKEFTKGQPAEKLRGLGLRELLLEDGFHQELVAALQKEAPAEWKGALASSGNMHNPKMHALWKPFDRALLETPTFQEITAELTPHGLRIGRVSKEKFELRKSPSAARFSAISFGVLIEKIP